VDKSQVFPLFYGKLGTAPMIQECPVCLECRLVHSVPLPTNTLYIGEIAAAWADPAVMKDGKPDFPAMDPLLLTMPDNTYRTLGKEAGKAWSAGLSLKRGS
jgi:flavin reductase (DIM6/NTAB) family NADH-FMN oxidoreductase RutF